jgi:glucose/arabinose dehydrogenase
LLPIILNAQYSWQDQFLSLPSFALPVELVHADDGTNRLFVVQQRGIIYVFENIPGVSTRKVFLDISDRVSQSESETGLLGLAFHPNYPDSGYVYLNYTSSSSGSLRSYIARYTVSSTNTDSALHDSEVILLTVDQPYTNHNGGKLAFGPDGYLYIGFGDGGSANDPGNRAQDRTTILGKILRINVDNADMGLQYAIPPTNPYYRNLLGYLEEIFAYGIRNPWKFSFDLVTGYLWLGDVGQDTREEVDIVINGGNYGWRLKEGFICNPVVNPTCQDTAGLLPPVWDYVHNGADAAITGGYVYRGTEIPSLYGKYIFGDYETGNTWALTYDDIHPASATPLSDETYPISTFGVDINGNIYLCSYSGSGRIYKLTGSATSAALGGGNIPSVYQLLQNYPNPFNPTTTISYQLSAMSKTNLKIYDVLGREVATLMNEIQSAGTHTITWTATRMPSGVYFYRLKANGVVQTRKMILQK